MTMDYNLKLDIPAKYLGTDVGGALGKLSGESYANMSVELPIGITGNFNSPQVKLNMQQAVNNLTQKVVAKQTKNLEDKAVDAINDILQGKRDPNEPFNKNDSTAVNTQKTDSTTTQIPTKSDSVKQSQQKQVKDAAKDILGGILKGNKKKTDTTKQN